MTTTKQTAGNNAFLAETRKLFNDAIFKKASALLNAEGEEAARAYLLTFVKTLSY